MRFLLNYALFKSAWKKLRKPTMMVVPSPEEWQLTGGLFYDRHEDRIVDSNGDVVRDLCPLYSGCSEEVRFVPSRVQFLSTDLLEGGMAGREFTSIYIAGTDKETVQGCWALDIQNTLHRVESVTPIHPGTDKVMRVDYGLF